MAGEKKEVVRPDPDDGAMYLHCNHCMNGRLAVRVNKGGIDFICENCPGDMLVARIDSEKGFTNLVNSMAGCPCAGCQEKGQTKH